MKILIKGAYGETNFGDDLLMIVFERFFIQEINSCVFLFEGKKATYPSLMLDKASYNSKIQSDIVVYGGGTQFFSFNKNSSKNSFFSKIGKAILNPKFVYVFFVNQILNRKSKHVNMPHAFLGFGLGPFKNQKSIDRAKMNMNGSIFIGVRDNVSFNHCQEWGMSPHLGADVVFSSYFSLPELVKVKNKKKKIGVIVRDWKWEETGASYIDQVRSYIEMDSSEVDFKFIVFAPSLDKEWMEYLIDKDHIIWNPENDTTDKFLNKLNSFDAFISARYHGAILGAILGKPVICIEIEPKLEILCQQIPEMTLWRKPFELEKLNLLINSLDFEVNYSKSLNQRKYLADSMLLSFKEKLQNYLD